jgi:hypothetical protein
MAAAVRYTWVFRTAAVVCLLLGGSWLWTATLTDYRPDIRPWLLAFGAIAVVTGIFLFKRRKFAIALSGTGALVVAVASIFAVPIAHGPGLLALGLFALAMGLYAAIAARTLFGGQG